MALAAKSILANMQMDKTLLTLFTNTQNVKLSKDKETLFFSFHNTIDPDLDFAGIVQGKLFCSPNKGALLEISKKKMQKKRVVHLDPCIKKISFSFDKEQILHMVTINKNDHQKQFAYILELKPHA